MRCTTCNKGRFRAVQINLKRELAGHVFIASVRAAQCSACGETYTDGTAGERFDLAIAKALLSTPPNGEAFRFLRKLAGLRAVDLAALLGVAPDTISRWETGKRSIDRGAFTLLGLMVQDQAEGSTKTRDALRAAGSPKPLAKRVALKLAS